MRFLKIKFNDFFINFQLIFLIKFQNIREHLWIRMNPACETSSSIRPYTYTEVVSERKVDVTRTRSAGDVTDVLGTSVIVVRDGARHGLTVGVRDHLLLNLEGVSLYTQWLYCALYIYIYMYKLHTHTISL